MNVQGFFERVNKTPSCWNWNGHMDKKGYGRVHLSFGKVLAHRLAWELLVGEIPEGMHVLHKCDNRACVRPDHLFLGTEYDNGKDAAIKDKRRQKLTSEEVRQIRSLRKDGASGPALAYLFGINISNVYRICSFQRRMYIS